MKNWLKIVLIIVFTIIIIVLGIVGISLWNVPLAQSLFPFLEISVEFPNKVIALFTALLAGATFLLALAAFWSIRENLRVRADDIDREHKRRALQYILDWARKSYDLFYDMQKFHEINEREMLEKTLTMLWAEKDAIGEAAKDVDSKLVQSVDSVKNNLDSYWREKGSWIPEKIKKAENELEGEFALLFKKAVEIRAKLKL
jgi:hypothetical protein